MGKDTPMYRDDTVKRLVRQLSRAVNVIAGSRFNFFKLTQVRLAINRLAGQLHR